MSERITRNLQLVSAFEKMNAHEKATKNGGQKNYSQGASAEIACRLYLNGGRSAKIGIADNTKAVDFIYHGVKVSVKINSSNASDFEKPKTDITLYGLLQDGENDYIDAMHAVPTQALYDFLDSIGQIRRAKRDGRGGTKISIQSWNSRKRIDLLFDFLSKYPTVRDYKGLQ